MNEYVWVSNLMGDASLIVMATTDIVEEDLERAKSGLKALKAGQPVEFSAIPKSVYLPSERRGSLPPVFDANGFYIVDETVANILSRHDLGEGGLFPVDVWQSDRATSVEGQWFCWTFGNTKSAFTKAHSTNMLDRGPPGGEWAMMPWSPADFDVAVTRDALGGPEVWLDHRLFKTVFMSRELGDDLTKAGFASVLRLTKGRVV